MIQSIRDGLLCAVAAVLLLWATGEAQRAFAASSCVVDLWK